MKGLKFSLVLILALSLVAACGLYAMGPKMGHMKKSDGYGECVAPGKQALYKNVKGLRKMIHLVAKSNNGHREIKIALKKSDALNLTAEQQTKLRELHLAHQKLVIRKKAAAAEALVELENILTAETPDRNKISYKVLEVMGALADISQNCIETNIEVQTLLNDEQNKMLMKCCIENSIDIPHGGMYNRCEQRGKMKQNCGPDKGHMKGCCCPQCKAKKAGMMMKKEAEK